jgi:endonuclease/exonuclease/phosphatase family metal-dependent hydrolase
VRLLSYNILDGGIGREDMWTAVIEAQRPDVVALVEADDPGVVEHLAGRLGMDFIHAPGRSHASALLSRTPITSTVNHALLREGLEKSLLEATVRQPDGIELTIGVAHLHAGAYEADEAVREQEIAVVLGLFAHHRAAKTPHLLCGDFNANAPYQRIDPEKCKPKTRAAWEANAGQLPRRVVQRILDAGYIDTLHAFDAEAGQTHTTFTTEYPGQRVDYIFAFGVGGRRIGHASVVTDNGAKEASDHFPVVAHILDPHGLGLA